MFWGKNRGEWKGQQWPTRIPGLYSQCSVTMTTRQLDNRQPPQSQVASWVSDWGSSVSPLQYIWRIVRAGGCPAVVAQWQSTSWYPRVQFPVTAGFFFSLSFILPRIFLYSTSKAALKPLHTHLGLRHYALSLTKWFDKEPKLFPQS